MNTESLNPAQRARLIEAAARRIKAARLAHYREQARLAAVPDYYQWAAYTHRFMVDLAAWCTDGQRREGCDPYRDRRGMVQL